MNISDLHSVDKALSAISLFKKESTNVVSIQLLAGGLLKEHISLSDALLICIGGEVLYEDEMGKKMVLQSGDYEIILGNVKHWLNGNKDSQLVLIKS